MHNSHTAATSHFYIWNVIPKIELGLFTNSSLTLADPGDASPPGQNLFIFMQFLGKLVK